MSSIDPSPPSSQVPSSQGSDRAAGEAARNGCFWPPEMVACGWVDDAGLLHLPVPRRDGWQQHAGPPQQHQPHQFQQEPHQDLHATGSPPPPPPLTRAHSSDSEEGWGSPRSSDRYSPSHFSHDIFSPKCAVREVVFDAKHPPLPQAVLDQLHCADEPPPPLCMLATANATATAGAAPAAEEDEGGLNAARDSGPYGGGSP